MILAPLTQPAEALFCKERGQDGWRLFTGPCNEVKPVQQLSWWRRGGAALEDLEMQGDEIINVSTYFQDLP